MATKTVDGYIAGKPQWEAELGRLRELLLAVGLEETIKWGAPCYCHKGQNVIGMNDFKQHFGLWFYLGARLEDKQGVLINAQEGKTQDMRQWRMSSAADIKVRTIKAYAKEAMALVDAGEKPSRTVGKTVTSDTLDAALKADAAAAKAFAALTPGRQREYAAYINEAKQEATRLKRVDKVLPMILAGKGLNDRYKK